MNVTTKVDIPTAADATVTFKAPDKPGKYMFWCTVAPAGSLSHAERGMTGEVIVQ
jgi:plastocyanin